MSHRLIAGVAPPKEPVAADIIILALDRVEETIAAMHSALAQTGVTTHVHILDQGSTPENLDRLAAAVTGHCSLFLGETNMGVAGGRNLLSRLGNGRIIVALDNDAEFAASDTVARLVAALDAEPMLGAVGCRIVSYATGQDDLSSWGYPRALLSAAGECFDAVTFVGAGHAIRRTAWEAAGGYDEALFFCWEEIDFALRAIAKGWRIRYRGDIAIRHKVSGEQRVNWTGRRWFYFVRNRLYLERKYRRLGLVRAVAYLVKGTANGMPGVTLRAIAAGWRMCLPVMAGEGPPSTPALAPVGAGVDGRDKPGHDGLGSAEPRHDGLRSVEPDHDGVASLVLNPQALSYLRRNDRLHRGHLGRRLMREVFGGLVPSGDAAATTGR